MRTGGLGSALGLSIWKLPTDFSARRMVGAVLLRRCALDCAPGREAFIALGPVLGDARAFGIAEPRLMEGRGPLFVNDLAYAGLLGCKLSDAAGRQPPAPVTGEAAEHPLKQPRWGWGDTPVAFPCTMTLAGAAALDRWRELSDRASAGEALSAGEAGEYRALRPWGFQAPGRDEDFDAYYRVLKRLHESQGVPKPKAAQPMTAAELERQTAWADAVVREVMRDSRACRDRRDDDALLEAALANLGLAAGGPRP